MRMVRQTWQQFIIKSEMGLFRGVRSLEIRFHWKFWKPIEAIGGRVYFGRYVEYQDDDFLETHFGGDVKKNGSETDGRAEQHSHDHFPICTGHSAEEWL